MVAKWSKASISQILEGANLRSQVQIPLRTYMHIVRYYELKLQAQLIPTHHPKPKGLTYTTLDLLVSFV